MIQITSRRSRGARLRRGGSRWPYTALAAGGLIVALIFALIRH